MTNPNNSPTKAEQELFDEIDDYIDDIRYETDLPFDERITSVKQSIKNLLRPYIKQSNLEARIDEQGRTGTFKYDDGDVEIRVYHPTGQYVQQEVRLDELKQELEG